MHRNSLIASAAAAATLAGGVASALAAGGGAQVSIRIEGAKRTLLPARTVRVPASGYITRDGAPPNGCPADSAAGVLNAATHGSWSGTWESKYNDFFVSKILGESESGTKAYFEILVNNVPASTGPCEIKLKPGDQLLFGAVPDSGKGSPLTIVAPPSVHAGVPVKIRVEAFNGKGRPSPTADALVTGGGGRGTTNTRGYALLTLARSGKIALNASKPGDIRAATVYIKVNS